MKILVVPSWYPDGKDQLMGIYHKEYCEALAKRDNIDVNMIYIERHGLKEFFKYLFMPKKIIVEEKGYKTYITRMLDISKISLKLQMKSYAHKFRKAYKRYIKHEGKPSVIHAMEIAPAGYAACCVGKKYGIPVLVSEHGSHFTNYMKGSYQPFTRFVLNYAKFTTVSEFMQKKLNCYKKCEILPNLVNTEVFDVERTPHEGLNLVVVSAFRRGKRIQDAIKALKIIVDENKIKNVKLTIVGSGYQEEYYKQTMYEENMEEYVDFVGRKTKEEIAEILRISDILLITSEIETFSIPGVEALAAGIPVITTACAGPVEYIDEASGKVVPVDNPEEMAKAIKEVYAHLDKYDSKHLKEVASRYNAKNVTDKAISIYKYVERSR